MGTYRPQSSDIDLIATIDDRWRGRRSLVPRLRVLHLSQFPRLLGRAARGKGFSACCNTSFVWESEISSPVTQIVPIASHVGEVFDPRGAFDVNPVIWHELLRGGITLRGQDISASKLDAEPHELKTWTRNNLAEYWTPLLLRTNRGRRALRAGRMESCLLGPARMHATLATGHIISKQEAGRYALDVFTEHAPIVQVALTHLRGETIRNAPPRREWRDRTIACMGDIIDQSERISI